MRLSSKSPRTLAWLLAGLLLGGCATTPPIEDVPSAETYYHKAEQLLEGRRVMFVFHDVDYPKVISLFQEVIDNYPYSEFATLAELRIADIHFERERYEEAESYYQDFVELHPKHPDVPYAIYRNGLCAFEQMREPDQDQTSAEDAVAQFRVLLERYPRSKDAPAALDMMLRAEDRLAAHQIQVGNFYYQRGDHYAAMRRYRQALTSYPLHTKRMRTTTDLANAMKRLKRYREAEQLYAQVMNGNPDDSTLDEVVEELAELRELWSGGMPPLPRSCVTDPNPACDSELEPIP